MGFVSNLLFHLSKNRLVHSSPGDVGCNPAGFTPPAYRQWRDLDLRSQFVANFEPAELSNLDVLDFGCGEGGLSFLVATMGARSVTGIDLDAPRIQSALTRLQDMTASCPIKFLVASGSKVIDLPDASVDLILCFDVLEHILDYREVILEWHRVLRSKGRIFIWWVPWFHPYGHHIHPLVPLPWVHALFPEKTLVDVCARIYDWPAFKPRIWDMDEKGAKLPNKWRNMQALPDVNRLTISRFERVCRESGLKIEERKTSGFRGAPLASFTQALSQVPWLQEFFCSQVVYKIRKD